MYYTTHSKIAFREITELEIKMNGLFNDDVSEPSTSVVKVFFSGFVKIVKCSFEFMGDNVTSEIYYKDCRELCTGRRLYILEVGHPFES